MFWNINIIFKMDYKQFSGKSPIKLARTASEYDV